MVMYLFDEYLGEALKGQADDYLAISHGGHGVNSYAINYYLVNGPLALFVQSPWGGVYSDAKEDVNRLHELFHRCAVLIEAVDRARKRGLGTAAGRLYVFESELRWFNAWGWLDHPLKNDDEVKSWIQHHSVADEIHGGGRVPEERPWPTSAAKDWLIKTY